LAGGFGNIPRPASSNVVMSLSEGFRRHRVASGERADANGSMWPARMKRINVLPKGSAIAVNCPAGRAASRRSPPRRPKLARCFGRRMGATAAGSAVFPPIERAGAVAAPGGEPR
jgi:hypothetical protein